MVPEISFNARIEPILTCYDFPLILLHVELAS